MVSLRSCRKSVNMTDEHEDLLDTSRRIITTQAKSQRRRGQVLVIVLLLVIAALVYQNQSQRSSAHDKDVTVTAQAKTINGLQFANSALTKKSAEQTVAEVELRQDVNSFRQLNTALGTNHSKSLAVYCAIAKSPFLGIATSAVIVNDCPKGTP